MREMNKREGEERGEREGREIERKRRYRQNLCMQCGVQNKRQKVPPKSKKARTQKEKLKGKRAKRKSKNNACAW